MNAQLLPSAQFRLVLVLAFGLFSNAVDAGSCTISSTGLAFGAYQPLSFAGRLNSADVASTATVSVICTDIAESGSYSIGLGASAYGDGDRINDRRLYNVTKGGPLMAYNIYTEATYSSIFGNGTLGTKLEGSLAAGDSSFSHTLYGLIPARQNTLMAGAFVDSLTLTLTYNP